MDSRALIPRPETELLVELAVAQLPAGARVLDVGTGSGAVALALADERPDLHIAGSDLSEDALALARDNGKRLGLHVEWLHADLLAGVPDEYDAILSNPPYVAESERLLLAPEIVRHEPAGALFAGEDGQDCIRALIAQAVTRARVRMLALEHGADQAPTVRELLAAAGFRPGPLRARPRRDRARHPRGPMRLTAADAKALEECIARDGVAIFPADTVYGLGCDPDSEPAVRRLYELKGRPPSQPAAIMFFALEPALVALPELSPREQAALRGLLPGPLTLLLPNSARRYPLAAGPDPGAAETLGLRVPALPSHLAALATLGRPLLQSSANLSGGPEARRLADVPASIRAGADLALDGGELPGVASTVVDLRNYARAGEWRIVREGPIGRAEIERCSVTGACRRGLLLAYDPGACDAVPESMAHPTPLDALYAGLVAAAVTALLTPLTMRLARTVGAIDEPRERGLSEQPTPLLGGLAIFAGVLVAMLVWLPSGYYEERNLWQGVMLGAALITLVGALDDRFELPPLVKLAGQILAAVIVVHYGVAVKAITLPFIGKLALPGAGVTNAGPILTVIGLVAMMNVVNFSDGVDGLAAGVCAIIAAAMAVIAFDLGRQQPGVLAALTAGAALGFLIYNFPPASSFMGDCGANLLGLLMGVITVEAAVKTTAVVSFVLPLILLAVPFLDTTFVVLKRLKYKQPIYRPDSEHFHHRMARIGFSSRRTIAYLYAWTLMLAGLALALRFVPYSDHHGHLHTGWALVMIAIGLGVVAASVYLVYVLEIFKFRRLDAIRLRRLRPDASPAEIERHVARDFETGEFQTVSAAERAEPATPATSSTPERADVPVMGFDVAGGRAEQGVGERQVDQDRVGADEQRGGAQAPIAADGG